MSMFTFSPSKTREAIIECFEAGVVPFVTSSPGLGKSSIVHQIAKDSKLKVIDLRLSQCAPEDLMGLPMRTADGTKAAFVPFEMFPTEEMEIPDGMNGWLLFLDEFNSAAKSVQAAAYKIILDKMVGQAKLHSEVYIVAAGNKDSDRAIVTQMSTAMQSRLVHIEMEVHNKEFMEYAIGADYDYRVLGFLEFQPDKLHDFKPDHVDKTFACPRTWEFASRLVKGKSTSEVNLALLAGTISSGVAVEFYTFLKEFDQLPPYEKILSDPETTQVPVNPSTKYAVITTLLAKFDKKTFPKVIKYVRRFSPEFQVIFMRGIITKDPNMRREKVFTENILHLTRFLNDDSDDDTNTTASGPVTIAA